MTDYNTVLYEIGRPEDAVCTISMNRPEQRNAINREMAEELLDALTRVRDEKAVKVVVLTGAGRAFSAGAAPDAEPDGASDGPPCGGAYG